MKRYLLPVAVLALSSSLAACGSNGANNSGGSAAFDPNNCQGGTLSVLNQEDSTHFDPARLYTSGGGKIPTLLFRTLTTRNREPGVNGTKVVPDLATDVGTPSDDAKTWTYHLKDGVKFEDGTPITSKDVKYGIERSFAPELPGGAPYLRDWLVGGQDYTGPYKDGDLGSIETPDDKTIIFKLRKPEGEFPYLATATQFAPVPKAKDTGTRYETHPVSSGPYKIETYERSKRLVLVRNANWSRQIDAERLACPDRVEVTYGLDAAVINQRIASGAGQDANAVTTDTDLGPTELARLSEPGFAKQVAHGHFGYTYYLAFNPKVKPFDDPRVRQAISYAVNRESAINAVGGSQLADPATTFLPDQPAFGYQPYDLFPAGKTGNPAKTKELLAQAGYAGGLTVTLTHTTRKGDGTGPEVAAAVQDALKQAGITVKLEGLDPDSFDAKVLKPATEPGLSLDGWGADWPSGGPFLAPIFDGRQILKEGGNFNLAQYDDPAVNKEIDEINKITDPAQAAPRWGALDAKIGAQALTVPLIHGKDLFLFGKNVKNAWVSEWNGLYELAELSVK